MSERCSRRPSASAGRSPSSSGSQRGCVAIILRGSRKTGEGARAAGKRGRWPEKIRHWVYLRTFCQPLTLRYSALRRRAQRDNRPRPALERRHRTVPPARAISCVAQALLVSSSLVACREVTCSKRRCLRRWRQRLCSRGCSFMPLGHGRPVPCSLAREELIRDGRRHRLTTAQPCSNELRISVVTALSSDVGRPRHRLWTCAGVTLRESGRVGACHAYRHGAPSPVFLLPLTM